jgi:hypothetical protein
MIDDADRDCYWDEMSCLASALSQKDIDVNIVNRCVERNLEKFGCLFCSANRITGIYLLIQVTSFEKMQFH